MDEYDSDGKRDEKPTPVYMTLSEMFANSTPTTIAQDVRREVYVGSLKGIYPRAHIIKVFKIPPEELDSVRTIEPTGRRQAQDWSEIAHRVVGF